MSDIKLGTTPDKSAQRDAIHVAIIPIVAAENLKPGQHVRVEADYRAHALYDWYKDPAKYENAVGIVDPFLKHPVTKGETFWLLLYQNTIKGMRHHWQHPTFPDGLDRKDIKSSEDWLRNFATLYYGANYDGNHFADRPDEAYKAMMDDASDGHICFGLDDYPQHLCEEFWEHYANVTGRRFVTGYFRCAC